MSDQTETILSAPCAHRVSSFCAFLTSVFLAAPLPIAPAVFMFGAASPAVAAPMTSASQRKARWYRYYNGQGVPMLSGTVTQEHMRFGYDALDSNMIVIRHYPPFTNESYAKQRAQREAQEAKRQADRNLVEVYINSTQATAQRDRILQEITGRRQFMQDQLTGMQKDLQGNIAAAASFERDNKKVPFRLKSDMESKRTQITNAQANIKALNHREMEVQTQYKAIIDRLVFLEGHRELLQSPNQRTVNR